jgi:DNA-binding transcriptional LysR family regulator
MEEQIGATLFYRSRPAMRATEHGLTVIAKAEVMESELEYALEQVGKTVLEPSGLIRFVTMPWICRYILLPNLALFTDRYPHIQIEEVAAARERFMDRGEVEFGLRFEMRTWGNVKNIPIAKVPYAIYAPTGINPDCLPWLGFRTEQDIYAPEGWLEKHQGDSKVLLWTNDAGILYQGVRSGLGKSLLPVVLGEQDPKLVRLSGPEPEIERVLHLQVLPHVQRLKRVDIFLIWLSEMLPICFKP